MTQNNSEVTHKSSPKIIFMGTPEFAVPSIAILLDNGYEIVGVVTSVDKYGGRGGKILMESAVKKYAISKGLHILQPKNLKSPQFNDELRKLGADIQIVVAFRMLPEMVWNMPPMGTYNLHGSLLPKYRGAAPIHWAVINGEKETGVTSFKLKHAIDTGDILFQEKMSIGEFETTGEVHDRMMHLAAEVVLKTVEALSSVDVELIQQDVSKVSKAPKIHRKDSRIKFNQDVVIVFNFIRGMSPFPGAWTKLDGKELKIYQAKYERASLEFLPGTLLTDDKSYIHFTCIDGYISILELQLQGKKRMDVKSFLNGYTLKVGT